MEIPRKVTPEEKKPQIQPWQLFLVTTQTCSPFQSQGQGQITPCTSQISESRGGWGFQMLPMCFFPNARIHEQYVTCFIKSFYPRLLTPLEHTTFSSLILHSYDLKAYPRIMICLISLLWGVNMVKSQTGSKVKAQPLSFQHKLVENES